MNSLDRMLSAANHRFTFARSPLREEMRRFQLVGEHLGISDLWEKEPNGLTLHGRALLIRPWNYVTENIISIKEWNAPNLWRDEYKFITGELVCFAEDAFGNQFAVQDKKQIVHIEGETGEVLESWQSVDLWCKDVIERPNEITGRSLLSRWESGRRVLRDGFRITPRTPLVLGGTLALDELVSIMDVELMRFRGNLATQIRDLPDGTTIKLRTVK